MFYLHADLCLEELESGRLQQVRVILTTRVGSSLPQKREFRGLLCFHKLAH